MLYYFVCFSFSSPKLLCNFRFLNDLRDSNGVCNDLFRVNIEEESFDNGWIWSRHPSMIGGVRVLGSENMISNGYSIHMKFSFNEVAQWRKIIDFKNHSSDLGFYFRDGCLRLHGLYTCDICSSPNSIIELIYGYNYLTGIVDISQIQDDQIIKTCSITDSSGISSPITSEGKPLFGLFIDNGHDFENASGGKVHFVRIYNESMKSMPPTIVYNSINPARRSFGFFSFLVFML